MATFYAQPIIHLTLPHLWSFILFRKFNIAVNFIINILNKCPHTLFCWILRRNVRTIIVFMCLLPSSLSYKWSPSFLASLQDLSKPTRSQFFFQIYITTTNLHCTSSLFFQNIISFQIFLLFPVILSVSRMCCPPHFAILLHF